jgi:hypothetical protein
LVNEDCLIDRVFVTYFNEIETRLKEYNCKLNSNDKNKKFFYYFKTRYYSSELAGDDDDNNDEDEEDVDEADESRHHHHHPNRNQYNNNRYQLGGKSKHANNAAANINTRDEYFSEFLQLNQPKCFFYTYRKCNFFKHLKNSYVLSSDDKLFKKVDHHSSRSNNLESILLVNNDFFSFKIDYNFKIDFKVSIKLILGGGLGA